MRFKNLLPVVAMLIMVAGCKPTENNYRDAYTAAMNKKQASTGDDGLLPSGVQFHRVGSPDERKVDGETVRVVNMRIKFDDAGDTITPGRYNVAVSRYKLPTNARAQARDMRNAGKSSDTEKSFVAWGADGSFYVIAATFPEMGQAAAYAKKYAESHPKESIVGLDDGIIIIEN